MNSEELYEIIQNIKYSYLSRANFPKLIIGTGLSLMYGIIGMSGLVEAIDSQLEEKPEIRAKWESTRPSVDASGIEEGLKSLDTHGDAKVIRNLG